MSAGHVDEEALAIATRAMADAARRGLRVVAMTVTADRTGGRSFSFGYAPAERPRKARAAQPPAEAEIRRRVERGAVRDPVQPAQRSLF